MRLSAACAGADHGSLHAGSVPGTTLDQSLLLEVAGSLQAAGVATEQVALLRSQVEARSYTHVAALLKAVISALDASPLPMGEWQPARELVGDELLARLVGGISQSSLRRYAAGVRETPDHIAWRLHVVARLLASLLGSYNGYGVRRWFERRRAALDGLSPAEVLKAARDEDDERLQTALSLADDLVGAGGAV